MPRARLQKPAILTHEGQIPAGTTGLGKTYVLINEAIRWVASGAIPAKRAASHAWGVMVISARPEFTAATILRAALVTLAEISGVRADV